MVYLNAFEEEKYIIAQANSEIDPKSLKLKGRPTCRYRDQVQEYEPEEINFMDVSPKQVVSVAAGLIPFIEHDDANRALMGANMQRQAVLFYKQNLRLLVPESKARWQKTPKQ